MQTAPFLDLIEAKRRKDEGIRLVSNNNSDWLALAVIAFKEARREQEQYFPNGFTINEIRKWISGIGQPKHRNCWGGLPGRLLSEGLIKDLERDTHSDRRKSHYRKIKMYDWS